MPIIYSLKSPITNKVYYVGYTTKTLSERLINHLHTQSQETTSFLVSKGLSPIIEIIEDGDNVTKITELYWIQKLNTEGVKLENKDGLINYQNRIISILSEDSIADLDNMTEVERLKFALNKIKSELPLSSNVPIVLRIKNIIETALSLNYTTQSANNL